ncbi:DEAD/DEAH box helicase [Rhodanobacter sp. FW102-FHT14D06]|uniref:DEAD/DEAH box helicase n=2 Tax=unclassified Rhodanobacter TaxID=2621553 RepID=A0AB74UYX2_9GAMM|nr:DEAD/DEAH box helicase [Rhodanobacter denitrificans]UJJ58336.1 DEAD/DEAH box helicase [Rhodanobacter denitrificans]
MASRSDIKAPNRMDDARCTLMDTVRQLALEQHFSRTVLKAAEPLAARSQDWCKPLAWFRPEGGHADALQCGVIDADGANQRVTTYLYPLFGQIKVESNCTCGQTQCLHAAAMLIRLQQLVDWPRAMTPLQRWQQSIETTREPLPLAESIDRDEVWPTVCLLQPDGDRQPAALIAHLILLPDADALPRIEEWVSAEKPRAQPHLSRQALMWQAQLDRTQKRHASNKSGYVLRGHSGADLLSEFLQAGICHDARTLQEIRSGAVRLPRWQWSHDGQGCASIELAWSTSHEVHVIDLSGLHYLDGASGEFGALHLSPTAWEMLAQMPPIPPAEAAVLAAEWPPHPLLASVPPPPLPPSVRELGASLRLIVMLGASRHTQTGDHVFHVQAFADYGGCRLPLASEPYAQDVIRKVSGEYVRIRREIDRETSAWKAVEDAGFVGLNTLLPDSRRMLAPIPDAQALGHRVHYRGGAETFIALEAQLQTLVAAGIVLDYDPELSFIALPPETKLQATLEHGQRPGWTQFELAATIDGEEIDVLPIILSGLARQAFSLTPSPGEPRDAHWLAPIGFQRWLPLPLAQLREWISPLVECLDQPSGNTGTHLLLSRSQAMALSDCLQTQGIAVEGAQAANIADTLASLRAALASAQTAVLPASFQGSLRAYQQEGLQWLQALRQSRLGGVLADDMGLGKTVQIIAHLLVELESGRLDRPALIVAPTSLIFNWLDEMARFAPALQCLNFTGSARASLYDRLAQAHVIITSYALLANDLPQLEGIDYAMLVLDEAQWIKNPRTQTARAVRSLRADHRLVVTGTPLENHLGELWAHFDAVLPGYLGDYRSFNRSFRVPIERREDDARRAILRQRIAPFLLRRSKAKVAPELPPKTETVLRVAMGERQRRLYESLRLAQSELVREALARYRPDQSRIVVLSALLRLRQVCCDPRLVDATNDPPESAKLDALLELIRALRDEDRQILVFSQFTSMLALITEALDAAGFAHEVLTGETTDRAAPVRKFQSGASPILLASLKAGGVGLNLTAADAVIHYDPWWNPAVELQAVDRAHRLGREDPIFVYKLLCDDTIEEKIEAMKFHKSDLADAMLSGAAVPWTRLSELDVQKLFDLPSSPR